MRPRVKLHLGSRIAAARRAMKPCENLTPVIPISSRARFRRSRSPILSLMFGGGSSRSTVRTIGLIVPPSSRRSPSMSSVREVAILSPMTRRELSGMSIRRSSVAGKLEQASTSPEARSSGVSLPRLRQPAEPSITRTRHLPQVALPPHEAVRYMPWRRSAPSTLSPALVNIVFPVVSLICMMGGIL